MFEPFKNAGILAALAVMLLLHSVGGSAQAAGFRVATFEADITEGGAPITNSWAGPARVGVFNDAQLPLTNQWMYHAVADIMLAHSLLAAQPGVDARKIGAVRPC